MHVLKHRVICAGMRRSGSTWLYNAVRMILASCGGVYARFEDDQDIAECRRMAVEQQVAKAHRFGAELLFGATCILVSHRDLRDVAASAVRRKLVVDLPVEVVRFLTKTVIDEYQIWEPYAQFDLAYESMRENTPGAVGTIAGVLGVTVDPEAVARNIDALPLPNGKDPDREVLLHPGHFTDGTVGGYKKTLGEETVRAIEAVFGEWMLRKGYAA